MNKQPGKYTQFLKIMGPGLLWAGAAIGVSHLVQSTRAGANFGFSLVWVVFLALIFKYPFFEAGPRYAASTGETLLDGYKRLGTWVLGLFLLLTFLTMFTIQAAVTVVTASLLSWFSGGALSVLMWAVILLAVSYFILFVGKFRILDKTVKGIIILLAVTTVSALIAALGKGTTNVTFSLYSSEIWGTSGILFMIALMGWMPSAIDISVWSSIWTIEKAKETGYKPKLKESLLDFNIGYVGTGVISLCFLTLGALIIYGSNTV